MEMILAKGIDTITFGLTQDEVLNRLGLPDQEFRDEYGGMRFDYIDAKLSLFLNEDDGRLFHIKTADPCVALLGYLMIKAEITSLLDCLLPSLVRK